MHLSESSDPSSSLLFALANIQLLQCSENESLRIRCEHHLIIAFENGEGSYRIADTDWKIEWGLCTLLPPGSEIELHADTADIRGHAVCFDVFGVGDQTPLSVVDEGWPYYRPIIFTPAARYIDPINRLRLLYGRSGGSDRMRRQILLQELVCLLLEMHEQAGKLSASEEAEKLRLTIRYLNEHYRENVTVDQLARMAGMERWKYSTAFQSSMGKKPLEYLNDLRIDKARRLLASKEQPLREIARQVGFNDEYYFNRRFTKRIGLPPGLYAKLSHSSTAEWMPPCLSSHTAKPERIVVTGFTLGELLTLGIKPVGADLTVMGEQVVYRDLLHGVVDVGVLGDPSLIQALRPDLIILGSKLHRHHAKLISIAPTAILDSAEQTAKRLISVAELLGKRDEALAWIADYESRWLAMWQAISSGIRDEETAMVLLLLQGQLYLMGMSGFAATIYHPFGFRPSRSVTELIEREESCLEIEAESLADLDGDRLFLLVDSHEIDSQNVRRLMDTPSWRAMDAVKKGRIHIADSSWNYDDPVTRDRLLSVMPNILRLHTDKSSGTA
jgi:AraC-like DNA-binding protein/ABC-type Fe3+-citrate transport system substrate-binding protein